MKNSYAFDFPVTEKRDVVVVGGGPAGIVAAVAAKRTGANTLLIERASYLGGMMTGGLVNSLHGYRLRRDYIKAAPMSNWDTPLVVKGISLELTTRLQKAGGTIEYGHTGDPSIRENYDVEIMTHVLDEMMVEAGVDVLFNTFAFAPLMEDNSVRGVALVNKSGPQAILADVIVDATGDADMAAAAGVPFELGRPMDGRFHGGALLMEIGGIDPDRLIHYLRSRPEKTAEERKGVNAGILPSLRRWGSRTNAQLTLDGEEGIYFHGRKRQDLG